MGLASNQPCYIYAGDDCFVHLALFFYAFVVRGTVPDKHFYSNIVPILKRKHGIAPDSS